MNTAHQYCIILAGGIGRRLWPASRRALPKQFLDFFGVGRTLLQQTFDRYAAILPASHIYVLTYEGYADLVRAQLPEVSPERILCEPVQLSTAPAAIWATWLISQRDPEAAFVAVPADHHIVGEDRFRHQILRGLEFVATHAEFLAIGVRPTMPNTAYGYIQMGQRGEQEGLFRVKSFSEKPAPDYAQMFVESGEFLWNTGIYMWKAPTLLTLLEGSAASDGVAIDTKNRGLTAQEELDIVQRVYPASQRSSIDLAILEKRKNVYVELGDFGWTDLGAWPDVYALSEKDADGNAVTRPEQVLLSNCRGNLVRLPEGMSAVVRGLDGYLVTLDGNILLICPNDDPALARRLAGEAQMKLGDDFA